MKDDIKRFRYICDKHKMTDEERWKFSEYVHQEKLGRRDFSIEELDKLAREWKESNK
jgi:hypothetical protein